MILWENQFFLSKIVSHTAFIKVRNDSFTRMISSPSSIHCPNLLTSQHRRAHTVRYLIKLMYSLLMQLLNFASFLFIPVIETKKKYTFFFINSQFMFWKIREIEVISVEIKLGKKTKYQTRSSHVITVCLSHLCLLNLLCV